MTVSASTIVGAEATAFDADHPVMLGINYARYLSTTPRWNIAGTGSGTDITAAGGPVTYANDDYTHLQTYNVGTTVVNQLYFVLNIGSTTGIADSWAMLNWTLTAGSITSIELQVDDGPTFPSPVTVGTFSAPTGTKRIVKFHTSRVTGWQYARFKVLCGANTVLKVGEFWIGQRRQMKTEPMVPFDYDATANNIEEFVSSSGVRSAYVHSRGQRTLQARFGPHETFFINEALDFWETDTDFGTKPFLWIQKPVSDPRDAPLMRFMNRSLSLPYVGYTERSFEISAIECGPNFARRET